MIDTIVHGLAAGPGRRIVLPALGFLGVVLVLTIVVIAGILRQLDDHARADGLAHLEGSLLDLEVGLERTLVDYATWDEAYERLHRSVDPDWAFDDDNLGASTLAGHGYDALMVFDAAGIERYGARADGLATTPLAATFDSNLATLVERARLPTIRRSRPAIGYALWTGVPALVAAERITGDDPDGDPGAAASVLVFVVLLSPERLAVLGRHERLDDLRVAADPDDAADEPRLALAFADRRGSAVLRWQPEPIGREIVSTMLPLMATCLLTLVAALLLLLRQVTRSERLVKSQARELEAAHAHALHLALHDEVTGLANRRHLVRRLGDALRADRGFALLFLDLDRFKVVNDTLGHDAGDLVLRTVADRLAGLSPGAFAARLGGDEFVLVLPETASADIAAFADRLIGAVAAPIPHPAGAITVGVSVGIAVAPADAAEPTELLRMADVALNRAKSDGRATHRFFTPDLDEMSDPVRPAGRDRDRPPSVSAPAPDRVDVAPAPARRPGGLPALSARPA